jgi:KipI family sensor histidine kinase inhibitor
VTPSIPAGDVRLLGDRALLVGVRDAAVARVIAPVLESALSAAGVGVAEVVCGFATVGLVLTDSDSDTGSRARSRARARADTGSTAGDDLLTAARDVLHRLLVDAPSLSTVSPETSGGRLVSVPCEFDGPDLSEVATASGISPDEVVAQLTAGPLRVAVVGFSPGFAYLDGLPAPLAHVPRRATPRPVVPAGSVALANGHAAVYPTASPGGWHLVGRTGFSLFSTAEPPYAVLAPGDRVHLSVAARDDPVVPPVVDIPTWSPPAEARAVLDVVAPGMRAVLQDAGRRGVAAVGVPAAGPADPVSFGLANALVGNAPDAGVLEVTGAGARLRCLDPCHVAVVGAVPEVRIDAAPVASGQLMPLAPGQVLDVHGLRRGCRSYVAVAGGLLGPLAFGSSASDELCRLGAGPLAAGQRLWAGPWSPPLGDHLVAGAATELGVDGPVGAAADSAATSVELRVVPGPHAEWFSDDALSELRDAVFRVGPASNRVGLRLHAERALPALLPAGRGELDSQCVVTGAVQIPHDGHPVVLLPDHATLGGYPVLAVVASADHGRLGQCAPGTVVRLVVVGFAEAEEARRAQLRARRRAVVGHYPLSAG